MPRGEGNWTVYLQRQVKRNGTMKINRVSMAKQIKKFARINIYHRAQCRTCSWKLILFTVIANP